MYVMTFNNFVQQIFNHPPTHASLPIVAKILFFKFCQLEVKSAIDANLQAIFILILGLGKVISLKSLVVSR